MRDGVLACILLWTHNNAGFRCPVVVFWVLLFPRLATDAAVVGFSCCVDCDARTSGRCVACPKDKGASVVTLLGIAVALLAAAVIMFRIRNVLPVGLIKLGVSLFQIIASGSTSYSIPWYAVVTAVVADLRDGMRTLPPPLSRLSALVCFFRGSRCRFVLFVK